MLSLPKKQENMVYLKRLMQEGRAHIPFERKLINELNVERYEVTQMGQVKFSNPGGTHDDRLWAFAPAVYASRPEVPEYHPVVVRGRAVRFGLRAKMPRLDRLGKRTTTLLANLGSF